MRWPHFLWDTVQFPTDFHIKITRLLHFWEDGIKTELCATLQVRAYETILKTIIFSWGFLFDVSIVDYTTNFTYQSTFSKVQLHVFKNMLPTSLDYLCYIDDVEYIYVQLMR